LLRTTGRGVKTKIKTPVTICEEIFNQSLGGIDLAAQICYDSKIHDFPPYSGMENPRLKLPQKHLIEH